MYRWVEGDSEPEAVDTRAIAFNRGFDAFAFGTENPYQPETSEYNFWVDGFGIASE